MASSAISVTHQLLYTSNCYNSNAKATRHHLVVDGGLHQPTFHSRSSACFVYCRSSSLLKAWRERCDLHIGRIRIPSRTNNSQIQAKAETRSEQETLEGEGLAEKKITAAVTVGATTFDPGAITKVIDIVEQDQQSGEKEAVKKESFISQELAAIYATCKRWEWRNQSINYCVQGTGPAVVLVHGFGASVGHWRKNIGVLSTSNTVYAIDLLGLGASSKPPKFVYTMETWGEMIVDFLRDVVGGSAALVGNSIGSLACLIAAAEAPAGLVRGVVLLNCAGGMNNKGVSDDWRLKIFLPLFWLIDFLLNRSSIATRLFNRFKSRENVKNVLLSVYKNKQAVNDELVEIIQKPAEDPGALDAFVSIITGPPGPKPMDLVPKISSPILLLWGDDDPFTPINGPVGKYFQALPSVTPNVQMHILRDVGHCPHDDRPELVHEILIPWLAAL